MEYNKRKNLIKYAYFTLSAALLLMFATRSSFLYVCNNWDDANSYFSMGKALFNKKVLYRDIFDQKGMYLYFFYGLAYLVSHTTFFGVYLLEVLFGAIDITGFYKILKLYIGEAMSVILAPLSYAVMVMARSFWWGGAAEEISLPFYIWGLYLIIRYFRNDYLAKTMDMKTVFAGGILAGMIANIKFTGLGFFFAWMALVWLSFVIQKKIWLSIKACFVFLIGMFIPFIPWIAYFAINNSLYDWYWSYVYINVFLYPNTDTTGFAGKIYILAKILYWLIHDNISYFAFVIPGIVYSFFAKGNRLLSRFVVPVLFGFLYLGIFIGGRTLPYYSLPLGIFSVFGFAFAGRLVSLLFKIKESKKLICFGCALTTAAGVILTYLVSMNVQFMKENRDTYFMYRFKDEVLAEDNPTLLNIGCLDAGLYTLTGIVPNCRWFQTQTLDIPEPENNPYLEQDRYIKEGLTDFVLARDAYPEFIFDNYDLIDEEDYGFSGYDFTYYLFKKKKH